MRIDHLIGLLAAAFLAVFGVGTLWFALFNGGRGPYVGTATEGVALLGFFAAMVVAVLGLARRRLNV